jgi:tRNA pseudouridine38-40 synthase
MNPKIQRYFIECSYDGTAYNGWQIQPNGTGVQQVIEEALHTLLRRVCPILGSGRTDTGVHARQQFAHVDLPEMDEKSIQQLVFKLNNILPDDITIRGIYRVNSTAHARFDAIRRTYKYYLSFQKDAFRFRHQYYYRGKLNMQAMEVAAAIIPQYTDFSSFCKSHAASQTPFCKVDTSFWEETEQGWVYTISADRFLRNMVRAIVGTMIEAGKGKISPDEIHAIIEQKDRRAAGFSAPANGLFLHRVEYPEGTFLT